MKLSSMALWAAGVALACLAAVGHTQQRSTLLGNYPVKPIRILVGASAGGDTDRVARLMGGKLADALNTNVIVDNRPGGSGVISMNMLAQAPNDGYTIASPGIR